MIANVSALVNELRRARNGEAFTIGLPARPDGNDIVVRFPSCRFAAWRHLGGEYGPCN